MSSCIETMRQRLAVLQPLEMQIVDESHLHVGHAGAQAGGGHYLLRLGSADFVGKGKMARHRMIYSALAEMMGREIHALTIEANTPAETNEFLILQGTVESC